MKIGTRWNKLEVLDMKESEVWSEPGEMGVKDYVTTHVLQCACGEVFEHQGAIKKAELRACADCTAKGEFNAPRAERVNADGVVMPARPMLGRPQGRYGRKSATSVSLPVDLIVKCNAIAQERGVSFSEFVTDALVSALADVNVDVSVESRIGN